MKFVNIIAVLLISVMVASCASKKKDEQEVILPAEQIYNESMDKLEQKSYKKSIEGFEQLERTYPYSKWAVKAKIMSAYASYKNEEYSDAVITLDKFIALHPGNSDAPYAYYLKAMCYYEQISDVTRDQSYSSQALGALKEVIARFPNSDYARDANGKIVLVLNHLAGKELEIGRFYLTQKKYIAAINRFKVVIDKYQTTSYVPEALHRLVEANMALGIKEEAQKYAAVLGYNYPASKWYQYSYNLFKGKIPEIENKTKPEKTLLESVGDSLNILKKQPNLVEGVNKKVTETENSAETMNAVAKESHNSKTEKSSENPKKGGIIEWFKNLNIYPVMERKNYQEPAEVR